MSGTSLVRVHRVYPRRARRGTAGVASCDLAFHPHPRIKYVTGSEGEGAFYPIGSRLLIRDRLRRWRRLRSIQGLSELPQGDEKWPCLNYLTRCYIGLDNKRLEGVYVCQALSSRGTKYQGTDKWRTFTLSIYRVLDLLNYPLSVPMPRHE